MRSVLKKVTVYKESVELEVDHTYPNADCNRLTKKGDDITRKEQHTHIRIPAALRKHAVKLAFVNPAGSPLTAVRKMDSVLIKNLVMACKWRENLESGKVTTLQQIADKEKCTERFVRKTIALAYLAPDIIESILDGRQPASFDLKKFHSQQLPLSWDDQRKALGYIA